MRRCVICVVCVVCLVAACGGDGSTAVDASSIDGPPRDAAIDALPDAPTAVRRVEPCPEIVAQTVTTTNTPNFAFTPSNISISVGDIVRFAPANIHSVIPHPTKPSDPGLRNGATGEVRCLQFTQSGTFNYRCGPHASMEGVVVVTN
jgi:plastocyanin